jgi:hypothetical protein
MPDWTYPEYRAFIEAIRAETGSVREPTLGEIFERAASEGTTPAQDLAWANLRMEWSIREARAGLRNVLSHDFSPVYLLGKLAMPDDDEVLYPPALDAYNAARLAAPGLSAKKRANRIAAFREAADFFGKIADGLEERLDSGNY